MGKTKNRGSPSRPLPEIDGLRMYVEWLVGQEAIREAIADAHYRNAEALRRVIDEAAVPALRKLEAEGHMPGEVRGKLEQACREVVDEDIVEAAVRAEEACSDQAS
jgi:HEAT repeat protein